MDLERPVNLIGRFLAIVYDDDDDDDVIFSAWESDGR